MKEGVLAARLLMEERFKSTKAAPDTGSFNQFEPLNGSKIVARRCSQDIEPELIHAMYDIGNKESINVHIFNSVTCIYDGKWWKGIILETNDEQVDELDASIKITHPMRPIRSFHWPVKDNLCCVPETNIICKSTNQVQFPVDNIPIKIMK